SLVRDRAGDLRPVGTMRLVYLDNLRVVMVGGVIAGHAIAGYAGMNWTYADVAEGEMGTVSQAVVGLLILPFALFVMALFFMVAGLLTPASLDRKGPRRFARDRLIRLGIPLAAFTFVLWPVMTYGLYVAAGSDWGLWDVYKDDPTLDNGPLWFVEALLIYSLVYAAWVAWRSHRADTANPVTTGPLRTRHLVAWGAGIAVGTLIVRRWFPFDSLQFTNAHVWQWPECIGLFSLGIVSARRGWLQPVSRGIRRGCGWVALVAILAVLVAFASTDNPDRALEIFGSGWRWQPLVFAVLGGAVTVAASIWTFAFAQQHWHHDGRIARATGRAAYAAFMVQGIPLILAALALRPLGIPLEVKALLVAAASIVASFGLGWILVTRTRLGRIM
ncbi:MAG TPA: acyltransferase, partial [Actinomycetota bacterium]|nr:acyltransferase [Actinomycetota bacterium]